MSPSGGGAAARSGDEYPRGANRSGRSAATPGSRPVKKQPAAKRAQPQKPQPQKPLPRKPRPESGQGRKPPVQRAQSPRAAGKPVARKADPRQTAKTKPVARKQARPTARTAKRAARTLTRSALGPAVRTARAQQKRRGGGGPRGPRGPLLNLGPARASNPDTRLRLTAAVIVLVFVVFAGRLVQLQAFDAETLSAEALENRLRDRTLYAHRGDILDTKGSRLAYTVERRNITVDQRLIPEYNKNAKVPDNDKGVVGAARALAPVLDLPLADLVQSLSGPRAFAYVTKDVEPTVWRDVSALAIPGIFSEQASRRTYPAATVASNVLGFMNSEGEPLAGIEKTQDDLLHGTDGKFTYERGANGQQIATGTTTQTPAVDGKDVQLTLDRDLQYKSQEALRGVVRSSKADSATIVVMNSRTGEILALAEAPTFDANDPGKAKVENRGNRALTEAFEPGSTSKVITAAAALEENVVRPTTPLKVPYKINRGTAGWISDSHEHEVEQLTFAGVLAQSSNTGTVMVGERMSAKTMYEYLTKFGLGSKTGVGLPESAGLLGTPDEWDGRTRLNVMFGQGLSVTALQSADVFATIANDGVRVQPKLIKAVTGADGRLEEEPAGKKTRVVSAKTAQELRLMLESVVGEDGTAVDAAIPGYRVAGKTGTAQRYDEELGRYDGYTASFVGMAPADDPELVVAVFVQNPTNGHYGGTVAAPVFKQIMSLALTSQGIEPTGTKKPNVPLEWS